jgi:hypothetical protein
MSDILERLRHQFDWYDDAAICGEAADEIERLRGLLVRCYDMIESDRLDLWDGLSNEPGLEPEVADAIGAR